MAITMEITPTDSSLFRSAIESLREFLPTAQMRMSNEGLGITGMDVSHVGLVDYHLSKHDCKLTLPAPVVIGVHTAGLARTLAGEGLCLSLRDEKLVVTHSNTKLNKKAVYTIPTLDITEELMTLPDIAYPAKIILQTSDFAAVIKEVSPFGDTVKLRLDEDGFHVSAEGENGVVHQTLENTDEREMVLESEYAEASFGTKYLSSIMKCALSSTTILEFGEANPLRTSFLFGKGSRFVAYLAPKLVED